MGVNGLWQILQPCARPTNLATLNRKRLAVDASIWIYQFLKAVRDKEGNALRNSHVVGFFRRICKLLWFGILPVFVFDGGAPALKRSTLQARRQRREGRREDAVRTAGKLLAVQMQRMAEEEVEKRRRKAPEVVGEGGGGGGEEDGMAEGEVLPSADKLVYVDEIHKTPQERQQTRKFTKQDAYHLPELDRPIEGMGRPEDPRIMSIDELEEYARQFHAGEDINLYDFSKIDFDGDFFKSLPPADRYYILNAARIRSRLRMGLSKEQLDDMFPDRMAFSRFQIERVRERNHLTQRLMIEAGMTGIDLTMGVNARVAGEKDREYILVKNEGAEGGWALGVVSRDKEQGQAHKPIDVDALQFRYDGDQEDEDEDEDEDMEFQDVPIEGLNRLPKLTASHAEPSGGDELVEEDSLFVAGYQPAEEAPQAGDEEEEDIQRAIAMSLRNQHDDADEEEDEEMMEDVDIPAPEWTQRAAEAVPRPIMATNGRMVAHIVNNRSNAAVGASKASATVSRKDDDSDSSDSELDIRAAMAAAARKKKTEAKPVPAASAPAPAKNPFSGPLPFEQLDWRTSIFEKRPVKATAPLSSFGASASAVTAQAATVAATTRETGAFEVDSDDDGMAGGFLLEGSEGSDDGSVAEEKHDEQAADDQAPRPLPPWMADGTDIRTAVRQQQAYDSEINAEDREMALEEERLWRKQQETQIVEIDSSDGSDVEILDAQPEATEDSDGEPETVVVPESAEAAETRSSTPEVFEDVVIPEHQPEMEEMEEETKEETEKLETTKLETAEPETGEPTTGEPTGLEQAGLQEADPDGLFTGEGDDEFNISDAEEEELLAQMAAEAEEHARFASTLNHRPDGDARRVLDEELRALRSQQKKDRRDADEVTQVMVAECQALLRLFGIPYITAPMEAEAQCAELVSQGLVDGIVTDDSDTFLFGGTRVYKNVFNGNKYVECFVSTDLERELSLSRDALIALAQLLGSDYAEGLPGVGPVTAMEILSEFPGPDGLGAFRAWWQDVQTGGRPKEADAAAVFRRKFRRTQATKLFLPTGFPSPAVTAAYLQPEVDDSAEPFQWGVPDLDGLRQFLMATIGWTQEHTDEVLVPVIRDMNRREAEGTQSNITRFFSGSVGAGASSGTHKGGNSRRMAAAVHRLKAGMGATSAEAAAAVMRSGPASRGRKRQAKPGEHDDEEVSESRPAKRGGKKAGKRTGG